MQGGFVPDTVIGERLPVHKLLSVKEEPLLVLNLCLQITNLVSKLHLEPNGLVAMEWECLHGNLHAITRTEVKVHCRMVLNLVRPKLALIIKSAAIKDNPLLVLYLCLDITDCIRWVYLKGDGPAVEHLHENLRAEVEVQGSVVLDLIVVSKCSIILELVAGQEQALVAADLSPDVGDRV